MQILNLRPSGGGGTLAAMFDVEVSPGLCLKSWELRRSATGIWRTFAPSTRGGTPSAILLPEVHDTITAAAATVFGGQAPHVRTR